jgi:hypothetical protein
LVVSCYVLLRARRRSVDGVASRRRPSLLHAACRLLPHPHTSTPRFNPALTPKVHVLADTTYNPLSVDEVAALHVNGDCVVRPLGAAGGDSDW